MEKGKIIVYIFSNGGGDIVKCNGFGTQDLLEMEKQMQEPEQFQGMNRGLYELKAKYVEPQRDHKGRTEVEGYWEFEHINLIKED